MHRSGTVGRALTAALLSCALMSGVSVRARGASQDKKSTDEGLPLLPARTARFTVTEGTWMSLDVSPDGRTIVFDLLGDIYMLPITGGTATRITSGTAFNQQPRFSPEGSRIAFISDKSGSDNLWVADKDGQNGHRISTLRGYWSGKSLTSPVWSPDGRLIVVSQRVGAATSDVVLPKDNDRWRLAAYEVSSGQMRWLGNHVGAQDWFGPTFTADGLTVYGSMNVFAFLGQYLSPLTPWRIARVNVTTGDTAVGYRAAEMPVGLRPVISRDGRYLAYVSGRGAHFGFRLRDISSGQERWLAKDILSSVFEFIDGSSDYLPGYAFMPDASALVAAYDGKIRRIDLKTGEVTEIPFRADVERPMASLSIHPHRLPEGQVRARGVMQPALSPDGSWVAFSALDRIWLMALPHGDRPAGRPLRLTADSVGEFYPSWSPDGRWIAYSVWEDGVGGTVRRSDVAPAQANAPGASQVLSREPAKFFHTAVAPDGQRIVAVRMSMTADRLLATNEGQGTEVIEPSERSVVWFPRVFMTGLTQFGTDPVIRTLDDAREAVRPYGEDFDTEMLKIYYDRFTDRRIRQLLKMAADELKLNSTAHVDGVEMLLTCAIDGMSIEHTVSHPRHIYGDVGELHAQSGVTQTMTFLVWIGGGLHQELFKRYGAPWDWPPMRQFLPPSAWPMIQLDAELGARARECNDFALCVVPQLSYAALIARHGGKVAVGAHGNGSPMGFHYEMWAYAMGGMPIHDILRAATINGATAIGYGKEFGSLEPGKVADLQVLDANPLEEIKNTMSVRYVMKNGRLYQAEDLTEIWPRQRSLPAVYLWDRAARKQDSQ